MIDSSQTDPADRSETVAFRAGSSTKHLIRAAAAKHQVLPSDWLRAAVERALEKEIGPGCLGREPLRPQDFAAVRYTEKELPPDERGS